MTDASIHQMLTAALAEHRKGRLAEAEVVYRQALSARPNHPDALHLLGTLAGQVGKHDVAVDLIRRAIAVNPLVGLYHNNVAECYRTLGRFPEAVIAFTEAVRLQPDVAMFQANLSGALSDVRDYEPAVDAARRAVALQPDYAMGLGNLGSALQELGFHDEAVTALRRAVQLDAAYADGYNNLAAALMGLERFGEAVTIYREAIRLKPDFGEAHMNLSAALIMTGEWLEGFREYEWRGRNHRGWDRPQQFAQPRWNGEALAGRRILLHCEQGIGDTLQMLRYVPLVAARGGRVILQIPPALHRLLATTPGVSQFILDGQPVPAFDVHSPLMSLPMLLQTTLQNVPPTDPPVPADPALVDSFSKLIHGPGLKVGIAWAGNPAFRHDRFRSASLSQLGALSRAKGVRFFSLQKGPARDQLTSPPVGLDVTDLSAHLNDFADTAAAIANLDLVLSTCTSVAHLAGVMKRPLWMMLTTSADWRWLRNRDDSPWYPSARLFRQPHRGDWGSLADRIASELPALARRSVGGA